MPGASGVTGISSIRWLPSIVNLEEFYLLADGLVGRYFELRFMNATEHG